MSLERPVDGERIVNRGHALVGALALGADGHRTEGLSPLWRADHLTVPASTSSVRPPGKLSRWSDAATCASGTRAPRRSPREHDRVACRGDRARVDMVEFDVVDSPDGGSSSRTRKEIAPARTPSTRARLPRPRGPGRPQSRPRPQVARVRGGVVAVLRQHELVDRALVSSFFPKSLRRFRELEPELTTGISYPWDEAGSRPSAALDGLRADGVAALRRALPTASAAWRRPPVPAPRCSTTRCSPASRSRRCHARGVSVFAWTVDEPELLSAS